MAWANTPNMKPRGTLENMGSVAILKPIELLAWLYKNVKICCLFLGRPSIYILGN